MNMFMSTLQGPYLDRMVGSASSGFSNLVAIGERIENCLKMETFRVLLLHQMRPRSLIPALQKRMKEKPIMLPHPRGKVKLNKSHIIKLLR